jgi:hypothetical protein
MSQQRCIGHMVSAPVWILRQSNNGNESARIEQGIDEGENTQYCTLGFRTIVAVARC